MTELQLIEIIVFQATGRESAWEDLIRPCRPVLGQIARRFRTSGEDLESELYLHLQKNNWRRLRSYRDKPGSSFVAWMSTVAYNLMREKESRKRPLLVDQLEEHADISDDPERKTLREEQRRILLEALSQLSTRCQEIVIRHHFNQSTLADIARVLLLKPANVRKIHERNISKLESLLRGKV